MTRTVAAVVVAHTAIVAIHGLAHVRLDIGASAVATVFIVLVIWMGPLVGLFAMRSNPAAGAWILGASMAGSFLFGLWNHFVVASADHVAHLPDGFWKLPFQVTAWLLLAIEAAGCVIALRLSPLLPRRS
jgi:hypothetical protein